MIIEGAISLKACINAHKRQINEIYIDKDKKTKDFNYIRKLCHLNNIKIIELNKDELNNVLSGKSHGGIGANVNKRDIDIFEEDKDIFYIDGIEDPFNLGYMMRTLYAFGFKNVLLSSRDYHNMEMQLLKSSAGAYEYLNIKISENIIKEINDYKQKEYHIISLFRNEKANDIFRTTFKEKNFFILGGEKRGIKKELLNISDEYLYIPYGSDFRNALNGAAALDVLVTLLYKTRNY